MAGSADLIIEQGADWIRNIYWQDSNSAYVNVAGYTARMQVREHRSSPSTILELTTSNGRIAVTAVSGLFTMTLTNAETTAMTWDAGYYDLEVVSSAGFVTRLLEGKIKLNKQITR